MSRPGVATAGGQGPFFFRGNAVLDGTLSAVNTFTPAVGSPATRTVPGTTVGFGGAVFGRPIVSRIPTAPPTSVVQPGAEQPFRGTVVIEGVIRILGETGEAASPGPATAIPPRTPSPAAPMSNSGVRMATRIDPQTPPGTVIR